MCIFACVLCHAWWSQRASRKAFVEWGQAGEMGERTPEGIGSRGQRVWSTSASLLPHRGEADGLVLLDEISQGPGCRPKAMTCCLLVLVAARQRRKQSGVNRQATRSARQRGQRRSTAMLVLLIHSLRRCYNHIDAWERERAGGFDEVSRSNAHGVSSCFG